MPDLCIVLLQSDDVLKRFTEVACATLRDAGLTEEQQALLTSDHLKEMYVPSHTQLLAVVSVVLGMSACICVCACRVRYGASEVHAIAAIMGGMAAQEAVKVIARQFLPLDNTVVFNGITSTAGSFKL